MASSYQRSRLTFVGRSPLDLRRIVVDSHPSEGIEELYEVLESRTEGALRVEWLELREPTGKPEVDRLGRITDGKQTLLFYAPDRDSLSSMAAGCLANPLNLQPD